MAVKSIDEVLVERGLRYSRMGLMLALKDCSSDCSIVDAYAEWLLSRGVELVMVEGRLTRVGELPRLCRERGDACIVNRVVPMR